MPRYFLEGVASVLRNAYVACDALVLNPRNVLCLVVGVKDLPNLLCLKLWEQPLTAESDKALVTGESIGQVASQTMNALAVTDDVVNMPVFRPVIGMDKEEIVEISRKIDTFETSILPYEDCCTVFTPKHPATKPIIEKVAAAQNILDVEKLIEDAVNGTEMLYV